MYDTSLRAASDFSGSEHRKSSTGGPAESSALVQALIVTHPVSWNSGARRAARDTISLGHCQFEPNHQYLLNSLASSLDLALGYDEQLSIVIDAM